MVMSVPVRSGELTLLMESQLKRQTKLKIQTNCYIVNALLFVHCDLYVRWS